MPLNSDGSPQFTLRGGNAALFDSNDTECLISGPAGTGKSLAALAKLHYCASHIPGLQAAIVRKTRESLTNTGLKTFELDVLGTPRHQLLRTGGQRRNRQSYPYPNGSEIIVIGMDKPSKIMSANLDIIYAQEAIELWEVDWEFLITRLRNGKLPYQQLLADTNPDAPTHWLKKRCEAGKCRMIESRHEDNPSLHNGEDWTEHGASYLEKLDSLTGPRKLRLRHGRWVQAEGVVYEGWDRAVHLIDRFDPPPEWERYWSVDFGWNDPFVCLCFARDHDGRLYLYREVYHSKRLVEDHARRLRDLHWQEAEEWAQKRNVPAASVEKQLRPRWVACDHDREGRATLQRHLGEAGIGVIGANKRELKPGIESVALRLRVQGDGKPRLFIMRDSLDQRDEDLAGVPASVVDEFDAYIWNNKSTKDVPVDKHNHGLDALRYCIHTMDFAGRWEAASSIPNPASQGGHDPSTGRALSGGDRLRALLERSRERYSGGRPANLDPFRGRRPGGMG